MGTLEVWLLAFSLAMDCFTVSVTSGIILRKVCWKHILVMSLFFGGFQALMPLLGWFAASSFYHLIERFDHWIAFGLLAFLGIRMMKEGLDKDTPCCFDPTRLGVVLTLAIATSIDALAVGISFACAGMDAFSTILYPILLIGLVSFAMSVAGNLIGVFFGKHANLRMEFWGGLILIGIGIRILIEHLS